MSAKITKHRDGDSWRIAVNGATTELFIVKGDRPKFREPQTYDVLNGEEFLFNCKSVGAALGAIETIASLPSR